MAKSQLALAWKVAYDYFVLVLIMSRWYIILKNPFTKCQNDFSKMETIAYSHLFYHVFLDNNVRVLTITYSVNVEKICWVFCSVLYDYNDDYQNFSKVVRLNISKSCFSLFGYLNSSQLQTLYILWCSLRQQLCV